MNNLAAASLATLRMASSSTCAAAHSDCAARSAAHLHDVIGSTWDGEMTCGLLEKHGC